MTRALSLLLALGLWGCSSRPPVQAPDAAAGAATAYEPVRVEPTTPLEDDEPQVVSSIDTAHVLPDAHTVVVVHVQRVLKLKLNPVMLLLARRYFADDCLMKSALRVEQIVASGNDDGWVGLLDGDVDVDEALACIGQAPTTGKRRFRDRDAVELGFGVLALERNGKLLFGDEAVLGRMLGPRSARDQVTRVLPLVPERDDALLVVGSRMAVEGVGAESSGYISGDLDELRLHSASTVRDEQIRALLGMFPLLKTAIRPALTQLVGDTTEIEPILEILDDLDVTQKGEVIELDLVVKDVESLIAKLLAEQLAEK